MKRNTQQRRRQIIDVLNQQGETSVEHFAALFATSEVTIRKDLAALEQNGLILRRLGGAILMPIETPEQSEKVSTRKKLIGQMAADLISDHARIVIDSGSTTHALVPFLAGKRGLVIMTNSIATAQELLELDPEPTVLMTGGTWDPRSQSLQGAMAENMVNSYNFDYAFIGAAGMDLQRGTTTFNELTQLTRSMASTAQRVVLLAEAEKFQRKMPNLELGWQDIDFLITDAPLDTQVVDALAKHQVQVKIAEQAEAQLSCL